MNNNIISRFNEYINSFHLENERKIAVAVSGGADSLALIFLLEQSIGAEKLAAITVNHNLREEAANEAEQVHTLLTRHKIEHHILNWEHQEKISANIQHKARLARRELLSNWCDNNKIKNLLLAHTKNDIAETFFMNIFRGSGIYGLSSIPEKTIINESIQIIRPVSIFTKEELKSFLREKNINWIEDPSNQNKKFLRVKVRDLFASKEMQHIFSDENLFLSRIITNVKNITRARDCIESLTREKYANIVTELGKEIKINRIKFREIHPEIALNILSSCLITVSQEHEYKPRLNSLELLYDFICSGSNSTKTLWKCKIKIGKDIIYIQKELGKIKPHLKPGSQ